MQKRIILTALTVWLMSHAVAFAHDYAESSVLKTGRTVKIRVDESGIYRISYEALRDMGISPESVRVLGFGGGMLSQDFTQRKIDDLPSVAFYMEKGADGVFGAGDYIAFYAQGPVSWQYSNGRFVHTQNAYSQYGYYFVSDTAGEQRLLSRREGELHTEGEVDTISSYVRHIVHEEEIVNLVDKAGRNGGGREFYGEALQKSSPTLSLECAMPNIVEGSLMRGYVSMAGTAQSTHTIRISIGNSVRTMSISSMASQPVTVNAMTQDDEQYYEASEGDKQRIAVTYTNPTETGIAYMNYIELSAECRLEMVDDYLEVRQPSQLSSERAAVYRVAGCSGQTQVWNISRLDSIYAVECRSEGDVLSFLTSASSLEEFVVVDPTRCAYRTPVVVGEVANQDLHGLRDLEMVIIYPRGYEAPAERLAQAHERLDGLNVGTVEAEQIYNEFSSGTPDATAYRWLMKMLYDRAQREGGRLPRYLLLMGDGSFDNRKLLSTSPANTLLTYQARNSVSEPDAYATDDYFCWLDDTEGLVDTDINITMDISVGRLPVNSVEEAEQTVDKIVEYMEDKTTGNWKTQICFLADDGDSGTHTLGADRAADAIRRKSKDFVIHKIYTDAYQQITSASNESYPIAQSEMNNLLQNGVLLFDYSGHGGYNNITSENMLSARDIREMSNTNLGFWLFATCSFSHFDSYYRSAGEEALLNTHGGAIGVFSACRTVYASQNAYLNQFVCEALFSTNTQQRYENTTGDAIRIAKNRARGFRPTQDKNILPYILLGDPAVRLHYPDDYRVVAEMTSDTLRALTTHEVRGYIADTEGDTVRDFQGEVSVTMWDKQQRMTTNDNDVSDESKKVRVSYLDYPNILFKGNATVEDGLFSLSLMIPKDIQYNYGTGRMALYAYDRETGKEGMGNREDFTVGGSSNVVINDTTGPRLTLYLNNPAFTDGGKTHEYPHFYAYIEDENGINTIGSGIGHDLMMTVDNDPLQTYTLNGYFMADNNSYQSGLVSYKLNELQEGQHSIRFRAWDLLNNSSSATLQFEVVKGYAPQIFSVTAYPNPVSRHGRLHIAVQHDKPDQTLEVEVWVYDFAGRLVWKHTQTGTEDISWEVGDSATECGLYFYRVRLGTTDGTYGTKTGKIIVTQ